MNRPTKLALCSVPLALMGVGIALAAEGYVVSTDPLGPKSILILPMTSTNQTLAFAADTATMDRVRYWARELDQASALGDQNTTFVYEVRNTSAAAIGQMLISAGGTQARITGIGFYGRPNPKGAPDNLSGLRLQPAVKLEWLGEKAKK